MGEIREKKGISKRGLLSAMIALLMCVSSVVMAGEQVQAENGGVYVKMTGSAGATQGDKKVTVSFEIENKRSETVKVENMKLVIDGDGVSVGGSNGSISLISGGIQTVSFSVNVEKRAGVGEKIMTFTADLKNSAGAELTNQKTLSTSGKFEVFEKLATNKTDSNTVSAVDVNHFIFPETGWVAGNSNKLKLELYNFGNNLIKNAVVTVSFPDGISIYNGSNQAKLGYMSTGTRKTVEFPVSVGENLESKNYPIEIQVQGLNFMKGEVLSKKTIYIPVEAGGGSVGNNIEIDGISIPNEMKAGESFNLSFNVSNTGKTKLKNVKVSVEPAEGLLNKSRNIFIESFGAGEKKNYNVKFHSLEGAEAKSYPIKIIAEATGEKNPSTVTQYATITITSGGESAKKPHLMVESYDFGGMAVQAGNEFILNISLYNTSPKALTNVKISVVNDDGIFVPTGGSNSFFVDRIDGKGHYTKSMRFNAKPQAEQKTSGITVKMTFESGAEAYEDSDIISIPVTQKTRLVVDELVPPTEAYAGIPVNCELQFYNMGKTVLNNLRVNCEGEFDITQSNSYYAGNMDSGKSDSYSFSIVPREVGSVTGKVIFTYEDANGEAQMVEVPFEFEAMEMPEEDEFMPDVPQPKKKPWYLIGFGIFCVVAVVGVALFKRHRKKKLHAALLIDEEYEVESKD